MLVAALAQGGILMCNFRHHPSPLFAPGGSGDQPPLYNFSAAFRNASDSCIGVRVLRGGGPSYMCMSPCALTDHPQCKVGCCGHGAHGLLRAAFLCVSCHSDITSRQAMLGGPHIRIPSRVKRQRRRGRGTIERADVAFEQGLPATMPIVSQGLQQCHAGLRGEAL